MTDWANLICQPCRGLGVIQVEDAQGRPSREVTCPYCHGAGNEAWVDERAAGRTHIQTKKRRVLLGVTITWVFCYGLPWVKTALATYGIQDAWAFGLWVLFGAVLVVAWVITPPAPRAHPRFRQQAHAPGFSDQREGKWLAGYAAALAARRAFDDITRGRG